MKDIVSDLYFGVPWSMSHGSVGIFLDYVFEEVEMICSNGFLEAVIS